jgi:serine/threonine-protein kinase
VIARDGPVVPSDAPSSLGGTLDGRYRIERVLGAGGLGTVYVATQLRIGRPVAIKMLHAELLPSADLRERFDREVATLGRLAHPHIVALTDSGVLPDGRGYLVMELLEGQSLEERIQSGGPIEPSEAVRIARQMLLGLAEAHDKGVLHRDLKPANVFLQPLAEGVHVKLLDFGLAKVRSDVATHPGDYATLTADGVIVGTPTYMAPEQATAQKIGAPADLYAVGIVLFEMLAGRPPFRSDDKLETIRAHLLAPVPELDAIAKELRPTDALRAFVRRALEKDHARRFPDARTMLRELDALPSPVATIAPGAARAPAAARASAPSSQGTEDTLALRSAELEPISAAGAATAIGRPPPPAPTRSRPQSPPVPRRMIVLAAIGGIAVLGLGLFAWLSARRAHVAPATTAPATTVTTATSDDVDDVEATGADGAVSPFAHADLPDELRDARRDVSRGHALSDDESRVVEAYRRRHPEDARAPLLLARSARFHTAWSDMVSLYVDAYAADPSSVGFAPMLGDLVRASGEPTSSRAASDAVVRMFGASAIDAVDARLAEIEDAAERQRVTRLRRRLGDD